MLDEIERRIKKLLDDALHGKTPKISIEHYQLAISVSNKITVSGNASQEEISQWAEKLAESLSLFND